MVLLLAVAIAIIPMVPAVTMSLKPYREIFKYPPILFPETVDLGGYLRLLGLMGTPPISGMPTIEKNEFVNYTIHSAIIAITTSLLAIVLSIPAAYSLARFRFKGKNVFGMLVLLLYMTPAYVLLVPYFILFRNLGLVDTYPGMILIYLTFCAPLGVWFLRGYFATIPWEIEEAALIDGCTRLGALFRIIVPISLPAIAGVFLFSFIQCWGEFLYAVVFTGANTRTISIGLFQFIGEYYTDWPAIMAGSLLFSVPVAVIFIVSQKFFLKGLVTGAVKK